MAPSVPTLYHSMYLCSSIPYNIALELKIPKESLAVKEVQMEELRKGTDLVLLSPRRVLPVLEFPDGSTMLEAGAIALYLLEHHDKEGALHPLQPSPQRAKFLQAVFYTVTEMYKSVIDIFFLCYQLEKEKRDREKLKVACDKFHKIVTDHIVRELDNGKKHYYLGDTFSAADIAVCYVLMTAEYCDEGLLEGVVAEYFARLRKRESFSQLYPGM